MVRPICFVNIPALPSVVTVSGTTVPATFAYAPTHTNYFGGTSCGLSTGQFRLCSSCNSVLKNQSSTNQFYSGHTDAEHPPPARLNRQMHPPCVGFGQGVCRDARRLRDTNCVKHASPHSLHLRPDPSGQHQQRQLPVRMQDPAREGSGFRRPYHLLGAPYRRGRQRLYQALYLHCPPADYHDEVCGQQNSGHRRSDSHDRCDCVCDELDHQDHTVYHYCVCSHVDVDLFPHGYRYTSLWPSSSPRQPQA